METTSSVCFNCIDIQPINDEWVDASQIWVDVLRLDKMHPLISGNKWFKLHYYLEDYAKSGCQSVSTFGGAYSNHIAATAVACRLAHIPVHGFIRGEEPVQLSPTLLLARKNGMELHFISRRDFRHREALRHLIPDSYWIDEGGYGPAGAKGAADIWNYVPAASGYTHIFTAVGTGTTLAGLANGAGTAQTIMGVSVMKNNFSLMEETKALLDPHRGSKNIQLLHRYHFGGYARCRPELIAFMKECWDKYALPTDFVYTAKAFYALKQEVLTGHIPAGSQLLFIHTGGLQGNASLPPGTLPY